MKTRSKKARPVNKSFQYKETFVDVDDTITDLEVVETVCSVCEAEFLDAEDLLLHFTQVHLNKPDGKITCKLCLTTARSAEEFVLHFIYKHIENVSFCYYCYRVFPDTLSREHHEMKHCPLLKSPVLTCSQCVKVFTNRTCLRNHEFNEHKDKDDGIMLHGFFALLSSALNMKSPKFIDAICMNTPFECVQCNHYSSELSDYIAHLIRKKCQSFTCDKCFNVYKLKHGVFNHVTRHPDCLKHVIPNGKRHQCPKCKKYFGVLDIIDHKAACEVVKCASCQLLFNSVSDLADHRLAEHKVSISLLICKLCKKEFVGTSSLKKHTKRAHKDKHLYKYVCDYCSALFMHPSKLFAHYFSMHKEIKPYTCKICKVTFRIRKHFSAHIKVHHECNGFVEFDDKLHVIFTDKKSEKPFVPQPPGELIAGSSTEVSDDDFDNVSQKKKEKLTLQKDKEQSNNAAKLTDEATENITDDAAIEYSNQLNPENTEPDSDPISFSKTDCEVLDTVTIEIESTKKRKRQRRPRALTDHEATRRYIGRTQYRVQPTPSKKKRLVGPTPDKVVLTDSSDDEPLSNIKASVSRQDTQPARSLSLKKRKAIRDKRAKLTCKMCNKYCYTYQNYHHHITLHEKRKQITCIKCREHFISGAELDNHMATAHSTSKLTETLKSLLEKRKKVQPAKKSRESVITPGESFKLLLEKRRKAELLSVQNHANNYFRKTIKKVDVIDDCWAKITPMTEHGVSVKNFIENFRPDPVDINISSSVTIKTTHAPVNKQPFIKLKRFTPEPPLSYAALSYPVKFADSSVDPKDNTVSVKLVQKLVTKPNLVNMTLNTRIPVIEKTETDEYCNTFADDTDYSQYKYEPIPEVAQEIMVGDPDDIPNTRRLAQEVIIPKIPEKYGKVKIAHMTNEEPFYKIVDFKKLLKCKNDSESEDNVQDDIELPDGTKLVAVKNPFAHLIPNETLQRVLKANKNPYYTSKTKNIEVAIAKVLNQKRPVRKKRVKKLHKNRLSVLDYTIG